MDEQSSLQLQERWDSFCSRHQIENAEARVDDVDGQIVLHAGLPAGDALRAFDNPEHLEQKLAEAGLRLLRYDVQADVVSLAITVLNA